MDGLAVGENTIDGYVLTEELEQSMGDQEKQQHELEDGNRRSRLS
jgi:hypothetical protein